VEYTHLILEVFDSSHASDIVVDTNQTSSRTFTNTSSGTIPERTLHNEVMELVEEIREPDATTEPLTMLPYLSCDSASRLVKDNVCGIECFMRKCFCHTKPES
jgi:hypothetical protein